LSLNVCPNAAPISVSTLNPSTFGIALYPSVAFSLLKKKLDADPASDLTP